MQETSGLKAGLWQWLGYIGLGLLVGFSFIPNSYYLMVKFPWIIIWQGGFLCLGIALLGTLRQFKQPFRPLGYGLDWGILVVAIACILSTIFAPFKGVALFQLATICGYGVVLYLLRNWSGEGRWTWLNIWRSLVIIALGMALSSILEWHLLVDSSEPEVTNFFPLGHRNFVAAYLSMLLPLMISFALTQKPKIRFLLLFLSAMVPYALYTTESRGGFLGFFLWAIASVGFVILRLRGKKRLIAGGTALVLMAGIITAGLQNPRVQRVIQVNTDNGLPTVQFQVDGQTEDRLFMWQAGLNILKDRPLTGVGLGNMSREYNLYRPLTASAGVAHIQQLHGTPAQLLGELGLIGGAAIAFFLVQLVRLGWRIHQNTEDFSKRRLLYGIGGAWFAYGGATLTDYQLENIPISLTLTMTVIALLYAADETIPEQIPAPLPLSSRRLWSLGSIGTAFGMALVALSNTWAMGLFLVGRIAWLQGQQEQAFVQVSTASALNPSSPSYPLRLGFWFLENRLFQRDNPEEYQKSTELALGYFEEALQKAPNDFYFNQSVAVLQSELDPVAAEPYATRAIQLLPRDPASWAYYLFALSKLTQGEDDLAIAALALQGLTDPSFMTYRDWDFDFFATIRIPTVEKCLALHQELLDRLPADNPERLAIQERMAWLSWWHGLPVPYREEIEQFSPVVQVLLLAETEPDRARKIIQTQLADEAEDPLRWQVLQAWFEPDQALELQFKLPGDEEPTTYALNLADDPEISLQNWLKLIPMPRGLSNLERLASQLVYREYDFTLVDDGLRPSTVRPYRLPLLIGLGGSYPRTFPALDQVINEVMVTELGLPHPTQNNFKVTAIPPSINE